MKRTRAASPPRAASSAAKRDESGEAETPSKRPRRSAAAAASARGNSSSRYREDSGSDGAEDEDVPWTTSTPATADKRASRGASASARKKKRAQRVKAEDDGDERKPRALGTTPSPPFIATTPPSKTAAAAQVATDEEAEHKPSKSKGGMSPSKLKHLATWRTTPFPEFTRPTPEECARVQEALARVHGEPKRPEVVRDDKAEAGCGLAPNVLDALVRTILSQNTTARNSNAAKAAMDATYGRADYVAVYRGGVAKLEQTIWCGGLAQRKARTIFAVLDEARRLNLERLAREKVDGDGDGAARDGHDDDERLVSLDFVRAQSDHDAMRTLCSIPGVGLKTASCVLLFCLARPSFAVDTHVFRLAGALGWLPASRGVNREQAHLHLDARIPDERKYALHSLLVMHGRACKRCAAKAGHTTAAVTIAKEQCPLLHLSANKPAVARLSGGEGGGEGGGETKDEGEDGGEDKWRASGGNIDEAPMSGLPPELH